jgi:hypothetical protein
MFVHCSFMGSNYFVTTNVIKQKMKTKPERIKITMQGDTPIRGNFIYEFYRIFLDQTLV